MMICNLKVRISWGWMLREAKGNARCNRKPSRMKTANDILPNILMRKAVDFTPHIS